MSDRDTVIAWVDGKSSPILGQTDLGAEAQIALRRRAVSHNVDACASALVVLAETTIFQIPAVGFQDGARVVESKLVTDVVVTGNSTNYATITLKQRTATASATIATWASSTSGTNTVAFTPITMTPTMANSILSAGDLITVTQSKAASGVQLPSHHIHIVLEAV